MGSERMLLRKALVVAYRLLDSERRFRNIIIGYYYKTTH